MISNKLMNKVDGIREISMILNFIETNNLKGQAISGTDLADILEITPQKVAAKVRAIQETEVPNPAYSSDNWRVPYHITPYKNLIKTIKKPVDVIVNFGDGDRIIHSKKNYYVFDSVELKSVVKCIVENAFKNEVDGIKLRIERIESDRQEFVDGIATKLESYDNRIKELTESLNEITDFLTSELGDGNN